MIGGYKARSGIGPFELAKQFAAFQDSMQRPPEEAHMQPESSNPVIGALVFLFRPR